MGPRTERLDLSGRTVIPGMVDAHAHRLGLGQALRTVNRVGTRSYDEVIARVVERARTARPGEWFRGRGWDQNDWADTHFPTHQALSRAVPNNPVYLTRVDGHAALVNAKALELAQVTAATPDPTGGRFIRDSAGNPTGVLVDGAQGIVGRVIPAATRAELREETLAAIAEANRWGLTGIHDAGVGAEGITVYEDLAREGRYSLRNYVMIRGDDSTLEAFLPAVGGRRARQPRRRAARAVRRRPGEHGAHHNERGAHQECRGAGAQSGIPAQRSRDRGPRQPDGARSVRGRIQGGSCRGPPLPDRACAD